MKGFSLHMSVVSVEDAHQLVQQVADLIAAGEIAPGGERLLRVPKPDDQKASMAMLTMYSDR